LPGVAAVALAMRHERAHARSIDLVPPVPRHVPPDILAADSA
jgi:hypothetical protein